MKQKHAVFAYTFSMKNAGDFSLNIAAIAILIENGFSVTLISRFEEYSEEYKETDKYFKDLYGKKVRMISSPFKLDRYSSKLKKAVNNIHGALVVSGFLRNKIIEEEIKNADIVILCGGNILRCGSFIDYMRLQALNYPLALAKKYSKEYVIFPQSTADINSMGEKLLGKMIYGAKAVFLRESLSFNKIKTLYPVANTIETLDLAFFLLDEKIFKNNNEKKSIAFTIRAGKLAGIGDLSSNEKEDISKMIINAVNSLKDNFDITFVVQGDIHDREITRKIQDDLKLNYGFEVKLVEERDTFKLIKLYSEFDLLIGMRLHSIILAAISGTPSYGLFRKEWGLKNPGILNQVNLPYSFVDDGEGVDINKAINLLGTKIEFQDNIKKLVASKNNEIRKVLKL